MFCPRCGQEQISNETRFCSRCGFLMTGVNELIVHEGLIPEKYVQYKGGSNSPKKRGIKQGALLFLSGALIVPLLGIIVVGILNFEGYIVGIAALLTFLGGILRMLYAILFESSHPGDETLEDTIIETKQKLFSKKSNANALPPQQSIPVSNYVPPTAGNWRDTNDLQPSSITENTTKLLENDE